MQFHETLGKGATLTVVGITATAYGLAGKLLFAGPHIEPILAAGNFAAPSGAPLTAADISTVVGFLTTIAGSLWTWYLLQKAKAADSNREATRRDAEVSREERFNQKMDDIQLMVAQQMAEMQVNMAKSHTAVEQHVSEIRHVVLGSATSVTVSDQPANQWSAFQQKEKPAPTNRAGSRDQTAK